MPTLTVRNIADVPRPNRSPKAVRDAQVEYENFVHSIGNDVGELILARDDQPRSVKVRLRRAGTRLGKDLVIWDAEGKVYFRVEAKRGRPRRTT